MRVRFAPSPTGHLHVGGARTALFNWLHARKHGGIFVLRIEDTDRERSEPEHVATILNSLEWMGLDFDEGPYFQSEGLVKHLELVERLLLEGYAYKDYSTEEESKAVRDQIRAGDIKARVAYRQMEEAEKRKREEGGDPFVVRFRVPEGTTRWSDGVHGEVSFDNEEIEDFALLRGDGSPTYNLAVVADDIEHTITDVIRGDDHVSNTPKQIMLYEALGAPTPNFTHVPLIMGPDGKRLSKRHGATSVEEYQKQGFLPEALVNFLALIGWGNEEERELFFDMEELVESFSIDRIKTKNGVLNPEKLLWTNQEHLKHMDTTRLKQMVWNVLMELGWDRKDLEEQGEEEWWEELLNTLKTRAITTKDLAGFVRPYIEEQFPMEVEGLQEHWAEPFEAQARMALLHEKFVSLPEWSGSAGVGAMRDLAKELGIGLKKIMMPLRMALTGTPVSARMDEILDLMGREKTLDRMDKAIEYLGVLGFGEVDFEDLAARRIPESGKIEKRSGGRTR